MYGSEPAFAPRIGSTAEDDGYVIVFATAPNGTSEVQVLNAQDFDKGPIARIPLPAAYRPGSTGPGRPATRSRPDPPRGSKLMTVYILDAVRSPRAKARPDGGLASLKPQNWSAV